MCDKCIILSTNDKLIQRFDFDTKSFKEVANKKGNEIKDILVSNDAQYVFVALGDRSVDMINDKGELLHKFPNVHKSIVFEYSEDLIFMIAQITTMAISNDNKHLLVGSRDGGTKLFGTSARDEGREGKDRHTRK